MGGARLTLNAVRGGDRRLFSSAQSDALTWQLVEALDRRLRGATDHAALVFNFLGASGWARHAGPPDRLDLPTPL